MVYDGTPITLTENTFVKTVAILPEMGESYVATFGDYITFGDLNFDNKVDIADFVAVLNVMSALEYSAPRSE